MWLWRFLPKVDAKMSLTLIRTNNNIKLCYDFVTLTNTKKVWQFLQVDWFLFLNKWRVFVSVLTLIENWNSLFETLSESLKMFYIINFSTNGVSTGVNTWSPHNYLTNLHLTAGFKRLRHFNDGIRFNLSPNNLRSVNSTNQAKI